MNATRNDISTRLSSRDRVPADHPMRKVKEIVDRVLKVLSRDYCRIKIPSEYPLIPPGELIRAAFLQVLYSIPTQQLLVEQLDYNLLFRPLRPSSNIVSRKTRLGQRPAEPWEERS